MQCRVSLLLFASVAVGCGLVQVNGKPVTLGSSKPDQSAQAQNSEPAPKPEQHAAGGGPKAAPAASAASEPKPAKASDEKPAQASAAKPVQETGGKSMHDFDNAPEQRHAWSPIQQNFQISKRRAYEALVVADELGDNLSQLGHLGVIEVCVKAAGDSENAAYNAALWAMCAGDYEAFSLPGLTTELKQEGINAEGRENLLRQADEYMGKAKALAAKLDEAAKQDAGVAAVLAAGVAARKEWMTFASAHADDLTRLADLQDKARENKNGLAGDCVDKTQPAFQKVARATKWGTEVDVEFDHMLWYAAKLPKTTEAYIAALAWGACAVLTHESGKALYEAVGNTAGWKYGGPRFVRRGPRSLAYAKLFEDPFKPKFVDRGLSMASMHKPDLGYTVSNGFSSIMTPTDAVISKLVKDGDITTFKYSSDSVMECVDWRDTNKVQSVSPSGDVMYEKKCMKRQPTRNEHSDTVTAAAFTGGLGGGVDVVTVSGFPIIGFKGTKAVAALGVKL